MSSHDEVFGEGGSDPGLLEAAIQRRKFLQYGLGATAAAVGGSVLTQGVVGGIARAAAAGTPTTLNVATSRGATNLDPNSLDGLSCSQIWSMCYDTFFNTGYPAGLTAAEAYLKKYNPEPLLATSHVLSGGGKVWTFDLQPKAKSAAGNPFTPADVIWSAQRHLALQLYGGIFLNRIGVTSASQFTAVGDHAVEMTLTEPIDPSYMLQIIGNYLVPIYDSVTAKAHATTADPWAKTYLAANTAGFGPYTITSRSADGSQCSFAARPDYYGKAPIPKVVYQQVSETSTQLELLLRGAVQVTDALSPEQVKTVEASKGNAVTQVATTGACYLGFNNSQAPFSDVNLHHGIATAINTPAIVSGVWKGTAQVWKSVLPPWFQAYTDKYWTYEYNSAKAAALLKPYANAGIALQYDAGNDLHGTIAELIQGELGAAGMTIKLDGIESTQFQTDEQNAAHTFWIDTGSVPLIPDPLYALQLLFLTVPTQKLIHYSNPKVDAAVNKLSSTTSVAKQDALILEAQKYIMADLPIVPIAYTNYPATHAKNLTGFRGHGADIIDVRDLHFT
jgi:peptide/nickel transport system substrate-binding protein